MHKAQILEGQEFELVKPHEKHFTFSLSHAIIQQTLVLNSID